jgi:hypothetical protein
VLLPGTSCSIRAHCASLKVLLLKIASVFDLESEIIRKGNLEVSVRSWGDVAVRARVWAS